MRAPTHLPPRPRRRSPLAPATHASPRSGSGRGAGASSCSRSVRSTLRRTARAPGSSAPVPSAPGCGRTRSPRAPRSCMFPGWSDPCPHQHGTQNPQALVGAEGGVTDPLWVRHDADDVAVLVADACYVVRRPVRVLEVAQYDAPFDLQLRERLGIGEVVSLVVGDGQGKLFAWLTARGPGRVYGFDPDEDAVTDEAHVRVAEQSARQKVRLGQDLEAVADAENRASAFRELFQRAHDVREAGDRAWSQVVAVGESAGNDHRVDTLEVRIGVPQLDCVSTHPLHTVKGVPIAVGPGEDRNAYSQETTSHSYSSIVGLESSLRHIASTSSALSTSISTSLPTWTVLIPSKPRAGSAFFTASLCGSRIPAFGRTRTRIFNPPRLSV